jgi:hypothetical protein
MATKMTVQFNLFGGTVFKLGTARHHKLLEASAIAPSFARMRLFSRAVRRALTA